ncbi:MAG: DUF4364 domain-containing protein [Firmicutes bacterium HGW-Firmicutes-1]|jgi:predicted transcriptional regulator|nr:MAG: DUF4364 domain-containing protein [Firmicutes bacterium HGW-Firmicutes-1]
MNATNQELSLNKLIILYMLNILNSPLTNSKISEFILNNGYTNYFSLQEYLNQMTESDLLKTTNISHTTMYYITESGKTTLEFFENRIPDSTKEEIVKYLNDNKFEIKSTLEISAEYYPGVKEDILVHCVAKENKEIIMELKVTVYEKDYAIKICENWKSNNHEIYKNLLADLTK